MGGELHGYYRCNYELYHCQKARSPLALKTQWAFFGLLLHFLEALIASVAPIAIDGDIDFKVD